MEIKSDYVVINLSTSQRKVLDRSEVAPYLSGLEIKQGRAKILSGDFASCIGRLREAQAALQQAAPTKGAPEVTLGRVISNLEDAIALHSRTYAEAK